MRYHNITKDDMLNGDGLRVVLWLAGCAHRCPECQNPVTWDEKGGIPFDDAAKEELFGQLEKPYITGITFSGGDPLHPVNRNPVAELMSEIRERFPEKDIWCYTGYLYADVKDLPAVALADVLVDGRFVREMADVQIEWAGSANQRVIRLKMMPGAVRLVTTPKWYPKTAEQSVLSAWEHFYRTEFWVPAAFADKYRGLSPEEIFRLAKKTGNLVCQRVSKKD